jgi:sortase B
MSRDTGSEKKNRRARTTIERKWQITMAIAAAAIMGIVTLVILPMLGENQPVALTPIVTEPSPTPTSALKPEILPQLKNLYEENNDLVGWLKIEGTVIDYPVMFTPEDGEFYLYRSFDKKQDRTMKGTLFIDKNCSLNPRSTNLLIHGHNMKNGSMFHTLVNYRKEEFYRKHPTFEYSTLYETSDYEIVAVFLSRVYKRTDNVFKYYQFFDATTEEEFDTFIMNIKSLALYETDIMPKFGDELITLATCEYSQANGRIVVVGRKVASNTYESIE